MPHECEECIMMKFYIIVIYLFIYFELIGKLTFTQVVKKSLHLSAGCDFMRASECGSDIRVVESNAPVNSGALTLH